MDWIRLVSSASLTDRRNMININAQFKCFDGLKLLTLRFSRFGLGERRSSVVQ